MPLFRRLRSALTLRSAALAGLTLLVLTLATVLGLFEIVELKAIDLAFNLRGLQVPSAPIVIVAIDDESIRETGLEWPWPRAYQAQLIKALSGGRPRTITTDIFWYQPGADSGGDQALAQAIAQAGDVILANDINHVTAPGLEYDELRSPLSALAAAAAHVGLANLDRDSDGYVRAMPFYRVHSANGQPYLTWAAYTAYDYLGAPLPAAVSPRAVALGPIQVPLENGLVRINFLGPPGRVFAQVPAYQVVSGEIFTTKGADYFKDKIVLVGATSESLHDTYPTPFQGDLQPMAGVEINAHVIDTLLSGRFLYRWNPLAAALAVLLLGLLAYLLSTIPRPFISLALTSLAGGLYLAGWWLAFNRFNTEIYVAAPLFSLVLGYAVPSVERALTEQNEKRRVRGIFERFVSPQMVEQIIEGGLERARGQRAELTILFSDIRGFTTLAEQLAPEQVVDLLNDYLGVMTDVILKHGGTIDKYEGDLIMAFFNAPIPQPDHARRAAAAAIEMRLTLDRLRTRWAKSVARPAQFEMGIGLNTGDAFVGLLGSEKRINYTCIGDSVNLAARVQDLTKDLQWPLLITEFTHAQIEAEFDCEFAGHHLVKGKSKTVGIYRVLGRAGSPDSERIRPLFS
jgi:adenylate cyclase